MNQKEIIEKEKTLINIFDSIKAMMNRLENEIDRLCLTNYIKDKCFICHIPIPPANFCINEIISEEDKKWKYYRSHGNACISCNAKATKEANEKIKGTSEKEI